jgi:AraC family transcriptional regulator of adaptative response/methylated-DNA-[protein]-cysteine methyltransferase
MGETEYWDAVLRRDAGYDGKFVYGVRSTGIYCRPSCASRRPKPDRVLYFDRPADAEAAGFRACRRCHPAGDAVEPSVARIEEICRYLDRNTEGIPTLDQLADRFGYSPYHLQRTFKRIVGVTPRRYAAERRLSRLKTALKEGSDVTGAIYEAGFGSSSAAYEAAAGQLGMKPSRYRGGGTEESIVYGVSPCGLGWLLVGGTAAGICAVRLGDGEAALVADLRAEFPSAALVRDDAALKPWVDDLLAYLEGREPHLALPLDVRATAFQRQVWDALQAIPYGSTRSYSELAEAIGRPDAVRAVAGACASNPAALVIPCHRVVRSDGSLGGYRWGLERKRALLAEEARHAAEMAEAGA